MINDITHRISRELWTTIARKKRADNNKDLDDALTALDGADPISGKTDYDLLHDLLNQRYATGIKLPDKTGEIEEFVRGDVELGISLYAQHVRVRLYRRIITATATLHTQPDQLFTFTSSGTDAETGQAVEARNEDAEELINWHRDRGGANQARIRADRLSVALGSAAVRLAWKQGHIGYYAHPPQVVYAGYTPSISDNDETRTPDYTDFEDAAVVAVCLGTVPGDESSISGTRWIAYFGRSDGYPLGRRVVYRARHWYDVPEPGQVGIDEEYTVPEGKGLAHSGEMANPLTWLQETNGLVAAPYEYPFVRYIGNDAGACSGQLLPTNGLALYDDCLELDVAWSRVMSSAVESAKDTIVFGNPDGASLPRSLDGVIPLKTGQTATRLGLVAANAWRAADVLANIQGTIAQAWNVPAHMVVHGKQGGDLGNASGYSIALKSQPLIDYRRERAELNEEAVAKMFVLEREMIWAHDPNGAARLPADVTQSWFEGEWRPPVNKTEQLTDLAMARTERLADYVDRVREYHDLATDADAMALIDKWNERATDYPEPAQQQQQPQPGGGGLRGFAAPPGRVPKGQQQQGEGE